MATQFPYIEVIPGTPVVSTGSPSVPAPAGLQAGDMEILAVVFPPGSISQPSGWSQIGNIGSGTAVAVIAFYRISTGDTSDVVVSDTGDHTLCVRLALRQIGGAGSTDWFAPYGFVSLASGSTDGLALGTELFTSPGSLGIMIAGASTDSNSAILYGNYDTPPCVDVLSYGTSTGNGSQLFVSSVGVNSVTLPHLYDGFEMSVSTSDSSTPAMVAIGFVVQAPDDHGLVEVLVPETPVTFSIDMVSGKSYHFNVDLEPISHEATTTFWASKGFETSVAIDCQFTGTIGVDRLFGEAANFEAESSGSVQGSKAVFAEFDAVSESGVTASVSRIAEAGFVFHDGATGVLLTGKKGGLLDFGVIATYSYDCSTRDDSDREFSFYVIQNVSMYIQAQRGFFQREGARIAAYDKSEGYIDFIAG